MRVKCVLCDKINTIHDETLLAKRLRNRPIHTYMCEKCHERIATRTNKRIESGNFKLYRDKKTEEHWS
ncbi:YlaI family protein [Bacillus sp. FJAT-47783]|uniref:YlaI family protein n=1 Tax=Bacillus sp. FJAT-47783 TaxID=2922712 RepID=UPI001FAD7AF0|nr:YlaI family protein [Bacillus sp. FJAT-47783]